MVYVDFIVVMPRLYSLMFPAPRYGGHFIICTKVRDYFSVNSCFINNFLLKNKNWIGIDHLVGLFPSWFSHLGIQCTSAILGGITTTTLINPLDIVRARLQANIL